MNTPSVVIVKWPKGFVAHIRYEDRTHDINISHPIKEILYRLVRNYIRRIEDEVQGA